MSKKIQQQPLPKQKKAKKCHGHRRSQPFKRKCPKRDMNDQTMAILLKNLQATSSIHQNNPQIHQEEKIDYFATIAAQTKTLPVRLKRYNINSNHWKQTWKLIPNYDQLYPYQFKDLLLKGIPSGNDYQHIEQWLFNFTILQLIQQRAKLMCTILHLKIEQDYWKYVHNLTSMPVVIWLSQIPKELIKQNFINWDHTNTKVNIKHRQHMIEHKLQRTKNNFNLHVQQPSSSFRYMENRTSANPAMKTLFNALTALLHNSLYDFRTNFEQKKILLQFDLKDAHFVKSFYDLNPTEEQVDIAQKIWRVETKFCQREIRQKKNHFILTMNRTITEGVTVEQQDKLFSMASFSPSMRLIVESRLANIGQRAQQLMTFSNTTNVKDCF